MKTYQILLLDKITKEVEKIEDFKTSNVAKLKHRLRELQKGYCEDEKPIVGIKQVTSNGNTYDIGFAESNCDYSYIAAL